MTLPTLAGSRCTLRALVVADAPSIQRHADDEAVWRNLFEGFPRPYPLQHALAWCGDEHRQPQFGHVWAVDVAGEAVGCVGVSPQQGDRACNAEVGYWIGRAHWGHGIATEALALATVWTFDHLPQITRIYAPIYARNPASQRVAAHCGYVREGVQRLAAIKAGQAIDVVQFAICRHPV